MLQRQRRKRRRRNDDSPSRQRLRMNRSMVMGRCPPSLVMLLLLGLLLLCSHHYCHYCIHSLATSISSGSSSSTSTSTKSSAAIAHFWDHIEPGPPDAILGIARAFHECKDPRKVNVCVGAYRDEQGQPWVLPSVRAAETLLLSSSKSNKEYLPIEGDAEFLERALEFAYGNSSDSVRTTSTTNSSTDDPDHNDWCVAGIQTLSGTGACRIGGHFLHQFYPDHPIYLPTPTWPNHEHIFRACGLDVRNYRYYDPSRNALDLSGLLEDLEAVPDGSIVLLHACAHNPTGCDVVSVDQQHALCQLMLRKRHVAFFDSAYQGFASGNAERDAAFVRSFVQTCTHGKKKNGHGHEKGAWWGIPVVLAQSFAKNFGLYGERCGTFSVVCCGRIQRERIMSQLRRIVRPMYSSPPRHGSDIVKTILSNTTLTALYQRDCQHMADRIQQMRTALVTTMIEKSKNPEWQAIATRQIGMFAYAGGHNLLTPAQCQRLTDEYSIFLTLDGRISLAGLNEHNLEYVAEAIHQVTSTTTTTTKTTPT